MTRFWRPETGFFLILWLALMIVGRSSLFQDAGTFWHTVTGERILTDGFFDTDPYSYTSRDTDQGGHWVPYEWLGECLMALVHRVGKFDSLLLLTATVLASLYTWLAHRLMLGGLHWSLTALLLAMTLSASTLHFHVRPHIGTIVLMGVTMAWLCDVEAGRIGIMRLFWLAPVYIIWTNFHGGVLGGIGTVGMAWAGWSLAGWIKRPSPVQNLRQCGLLFLVVLTCAGAVLVNPYGISLPATWLKIMNWEILTVIIKEHRPLDPTAPDGMFVIGFGMFFVFILAGAFPQKLRVSWFIPLVWFYLTLTRIRHAPLFAVTATLVMAEVIPQTRWAAWLAAKRDDLFQFAATKECTSTARRDWRPFVLPALVVLLSLTLQACQVSVPVIGRDWASLRHWPMDLKGELKQLEKEHADSNPEGIRIFNDYTMGGFLIYHAPKFKVFVDDRCEVYGPDWLLDFVLAEHEGTAGHIEDWQKKYGFDLALVKAGSGYDEYFQQAGWIRIGRREKPVAVLYRRPTAEEKE